MKAMTYAAGALAALLLLAACGTDDPEPVTSPTPTASPTAPSPSPTATAPTSPPESPSAEPSATGAVLEPTPALLTWEPTGRAAQETVTRGGPWTVVTDEEGSLATFDGPTPLTVAGTKRFRINQVLLESAADGSGHAVVVRTDTLEEKPAQATVIDLASGEKFTIGAKTDHPPASGGTWALGGGTLAYPVTGQGGAYCLQVTTLNSEPTEPWCTQPQHGFTNVSIGPAAVALMSFDDARPSCRTLGVLSEGGDFAPWTTPTECKGWQAIAAESMSVWTEVPKESNVETAHVYADTPDGTSDLGTSAAGSLTWCAGAAYFTRDPGGPDDPARLLRITESGAFETVYESAATGDAFLSNPRCGGDRITITAFSAAGDEQVSAAL